MLTESFHCHIAMQWKSKSWEFTVAWSLFRAVGRGWRHSCVYECITDWCKWCYLPDWFYLLTWWLTGISRVTYLPTYPVIPATCSSNETVNEWLIMLIKSHNLLTRSMALPTFDTLPWRSLCIALRLLTASCTFLRHCDNLSDCATFTSPLHPPSEANTKAFTHKHSLPTVDNLTYFGA